MVVAALRRRILELERGLAVSAVVSSSAESSETRDIVPSDAVRLDRLSVAMEARAAHGLWTACLLAGNDAEVTRIRNSLKSRSDCAIRLNSCVVVLFTNCLGRKQG